MKIPSLIGVIIIVILSSCSQADLSIYVSLEGDNQNPGTLEEPLASIEGARDMIRERRESLGNEQHFTVYLKAGDYRLSETIFFDQSDYNTTYRAYGKDKVRFLGGIILDPEKFRDPEPAEVSRVISEDARRKIRVLDLSDYLDHQLGSIQQHGFSTAILPAQAELFINNAPVNLARWPNEGRVRITEVYETGSLPIENDFSARKPVIGYNYERIRKWSNIKDIWLSGYFKAGFADDNIAISEFDHPSRKLILQQPHMFGVGKSKPGDEWGGKIRGYYAYNIKEEIDQPGEYYIDRNEKKLLVYPTEDFGQSELALSLLKDPLFSIDGARKLTFQSFILEYGRGMGIYLAGGDSVTIDSLIIRNFGTLAVMMGKGVAGIDYPIHEFTGELTANTIGNLKAHNYENTDFFNEAGTNHVIKNSKFYYLGAGGMVLSGGERKTLKRGNNRVENCDIHDFNRRYKTYCAGITIFGVGNSILHSRIFNAPHQGIAIFGNDHVIEYNHLTKLVMDVHDNGAIYIGRNPSERGNKIRYNYFSHNGNEGYKNCAIHVDDHASDVLIEGNVFYKTSRSDFGDVLINGGSFNRILNNLFIEGAHALWIEDPAIAGNSFFVDNKAYKPGGIIHRRLTDQIDIYSEPWSNAYPELIPFFDSGNYALRENIFERNVIVRSPLIVSKMGFDRTVFSSWKNNLTTSKDPGFVDYSEEEFGLRPESLVFSEIPDFDPIPFEKIKKID